MDIDAICTYMYIVIMYYYCIIMEYLSIIVLVLVGLHAFSNIPYQQHTVAIYVVEFRFV